MPMEGAGMGRIARRTVAFAYVVLVAVLATLGAVQQDAPYDVAAIVLTLPAGVVAVLVIYTGYPVISAVGGLLGASASRPDGNEAMWLATASGALNIVALVAAAFANTLLAHAVLRRRATLLRELVTPTRPRS